MPDRRYYPVPEGMGGRVDALLAAFTGLSRSRLTKAMEEGQVWVNGEQVAKSRKVAYPDVIEIVIPREPVVQPRSLGVNVPILYEDDDVIVVDKPAGMAAHPSLNFTGPDVLGELAAAGVQLARSGPAERHGIVHRLDVGTTGAMVLAKSELAYSVLKQAFRDRRITKVYHALVQGHLDPLRGTIDAPIGRDLGHQWKMGIRHDGRASITHYDTLEAMPGASLLEVHLETGRTHQIRVHCSALGHPCLGDDMYGADPTVSARLGLERQWLHAVRLGFEHPRTGEYLECLSPYPQDLEVSLEKMREGIF